MEIDLEYVLKNHVDKQRGLWDDPKVLSVTNSKAESVFRGVTNSDFQPFPRD